MLVGLICVYSGLLAPLGVAHWADRKDPIPVVQVPRSDDTKYPAYADGMLVWTEVG